MDIVNYSLTKKLFNSSVSGISSISAIDNELVFETNSGDKISVSVPKPKDGREIELRATDSSIQYKYNDEVLWTDLIFLEDIKGNNGVSIINVQIENDILKVYLSDGNIIDAGHIQHEAAEGIQIYEKYSDLPSSQKEQIAYVKNRETIVYDNQNQLTQLNLGDIITSKKIKINTDVEYKEQEFLECVDYFLSLPEQANGSTKQFYLGQRLKSPDASFWFESNLAILNDGTNEKINQITQYLPGFIIPCVSTNCLYCLQFNTEDIITKQFYKRDENLICPQIFLFLGDCYINNDLGFGQVELELKKGDIIKVWFQQTDDGESYPVLIEKEDSIVLPELVGIGSFELEYNTYESDETLLELAKNFFCDIFYYEQDYVTYDTKTAHGNSFLPLKIQNNIITASEDLSNVEYFEKNFIDIAKYYNDYKSSYGEGYSKFDISLEIGDLRNNSNVSEGIELGYATLSILPLISENSPIHSDDCSLPIYSSNSDYLYCIALFKPRDDDTMADIDEDWKLVFYIRFFGKTIISQIGEIILDIPTQVDNGWYSFELNMDSSNEYRITNSRINKVDHLSYFRYNASDYTNEQYIGISSNFGNIENLDFEYYIFGGIFKYGTDNFIIHPSGFYLNDGAAWNKIQ